MQHLLSVGSHRPGRDDCAAGECTHYAEMVRLRRDLHDGLGPGLAGIMMRADVLARLMTDDRGGAEEMLRDLRREAATFMTEFRRVLADREPAELEDRALADGVAALAKRMSGASGATLTVEVDVADEVDELDRDVQVAGFWIVKEALTNVVKHAAASRCKVHLWADDGLRLSVVDNGGTGAEVASAAGGGTAGRFGTGVGDGMGGVFGGVGADRVDAGIAGGMAGGTGGVTVSPVDGLTGGDAVGVGRAGVGGSGSGFVGSTGGVAKSSETVGGFAGDAGAGTNGVAGETGHVVGPGTAGGEVSQVGTGTIAEANSQVGGGIAGGVHDHIHSGTAGGVSRQAARLGTAGSGAAGVGVGLSSMAGRAAEFGGWCDVSVVRGGVSVTAHLPEGWGSDDCAA